MEQHTVRTLQRSKREEAAHGSASFPGKAMGGFFRSQAVQIGTYAWSVHSSLVVMVIALSIPFEYTCVAISGKENDQMATTKNLCAQISLDLHQKISEGKEAAGLTTAVHYQPVTRILRNERKWR